MAAGIYEVCKSSEINYIVQLLKNIYYKRGQAVEGMSFFMRRGRTKEVAAKAACAPRGE